MKTLYILLGIILQMSIDVYGQCQHLYVREPNEVENKIIYKSIPHNGHADSDGISITKIKQGDKVEKLLHAYSVGYGIEPDGDSEIILKDGSVLNLEGSSIVSKKHLVNDSYVYILTLPFNTATQIYLINNPIVSVRIGEFRKKIGRYSSRQFTEALSCIDLVK